MIPFGSETVTLYHRITVTGEDGRSRDVWTRHVLTGCSWRQTDVQVLSSNAVARSVDTVCRIPAGQQKPDTGDVLILGAVKVQATTAKQVQQLLAEYKDSAIRVASVKDNARIAGMLPHYAARGN